MYRIKNIEPYRFARFTITETGSRKNNSKFYVKNCVKFFLSLVASDRRSLVSLAHQTTLFTAS